MRRMILLLALSAFILSMPVFAADPAEHKGMDIEKKKEAVISRINKRINFLQDFKKCVSEARTGEDLKKCRKTFREERREPCEEMKHEKKIGNY